MSTTGRPSVQPLNAHDFPFVVLSNIPPLIYVYIESQTHPNTSTTLLLDFSHALRQRVQGALKEGLRTTFALFLPPSLSHANNLF